jgi:hypothetical protein
MLLLISEAHPWFFVFFFQKEPFDWTITSIFWNMGHSPTYKPKSVFLLISPYSPPFHTIYRYMEFQLWPNSTGRKTEVLLGTSSATHYEQSKKQKIPPNPLLHLKKAKGKIYSLP